MNPEQLIKVRILQEVPKANTIALFKKLFKKYNAKKITIDNEPFNLFKYACYSNETFAQWLLKQDGIEILDGSVYLVIKRYFQAKKDNAEKKKLDEFSSLIIDLINRKETITAKEVNAFATIAAHEKEYSCIAPHIKWFEPYGQDQNLSYCHYLASQNPPLALYAIGKDLLSVDQQDPISKKSLVQQSAQWYFFSEGQYSKELLTICIKKTKQPNFCIDKNGAFPILLYALQSNKEWLVDLLLDHPLIDIHQFWFPSYKKEGHQKEIEEALREIKKGNLLTSLTKLERNALKSYPGWRVLHMAAQSDNNLKYLQYFIKEKKIDVNQSNELIGYTPLMVAIFFRQIATIKFLVAQENIEKYYESLIGITPLIVAVVAANEEIVKLLLKFGFDPFKQNSFGFDAFLCAWLNKKNEITNLIISQTISKMNPQELRKNPILRKEYFFEGKKYEIEIDLSKKDFTLPYVEEKPLTGRQALLEQGYDPKEFAKPFAEEKDISSKAEVEEITQHTWLNGKLSYNSNSELTCIFPFEKSITKTPNCYFYFNASHLIDFGGSEKRATKIGNNLKLKFAPAFGYQGIKEYKGDAIEMNGEIYPVEWEYKIKFKEVGKETRLPCVKLLSDQKKATLFVPVGLIDNHLFFKKEKVDLDFDHTEKKERNNNNDCTN